MAEDDLISRKALLADLGCGSGNCEDCNICNKYTLEFSRSDICSFINQQPAVDRNHHSSWFRINEQMYECNACGHYAAKEYKRCPYCDALMDR